ncbi:serine hydrolase domain-containing protein [Vineibacter terrae]|uniref:serine hydrolase domain-containing protein n=1 Tax=Vineibacter terrae TaxID=2586908 RepID=UPI002E2EAC20|nr:serine hydrolase domain-containing protein [Vineibacter terrae]HEX2887283.1 serine hydrolase domain-containing protein [Vineibacter terrae]
MSFPLPTADAAAMGFRTEQLERLVALIDKHIADGHYPGCQIALARSGKLALARSFGSATTQPERRRATDDTLWLLYSNTKVIVAATMWALAERGAIRFVDRVADHIPEFKKNGKGAITLLQLLTHQAGFPNAVVPKEAWDDHARLRQVVCDFSLEWTPGSKVHYHGLSAHWVAGVVIEAVTGKDFRDVVRETLIEPLGLGNDLFMGVGPAQVARVSDMHYPPPLGGAPQNDPDNNSAEWRRAGIPGGGAYGTARGMAALYQMMLADGVLNNHRLVSPRTLQYAIRNWTGDRVDEFMGMPMHRGIGPHLRGTTETIRGLGSIASPRAFGHGGVGTSYCWADPDSGVSFAYITNNRVPDPWHSWRLDHIANLVHTAIL